MCVCACLPLALIVSIFLPSTCTCTCTCAAESIVCVCVTRMCLLVSQTKQMCGASTYICVMPTGEVPESQDVIILNFNDLPLKT